MNLALLLVFLVVILLLFEMFKHVLFKSFSKTIFMILLVLLVFFVIISTLEAENAVETENPVIETGAAVIDSIKEEGFFEDLDNKIQNLKERLSNLFS